MFTQENLYGLCFHCMFLYYCGGHSLFTQENLYGLCFHCMFLYYCGGHSLFTQENLYGLCFILYVLVLFYSCMTFGAVILAYVVVDNNL